MTQWPKPSSTCILVGGEPLIAEYEAYGEIYPGDLVKFRNASAADKTITVCAADDTAAIGFALITPNMNTTTGALTGAKRDQAFEAGDSVKVAKGDCFLMARLAPSQDIDRGEMLQPADSGELKAYECGTDEACQLVAQSMEDVVSVTVFQWILVNCRIN